MNSPRTTLYRDKHNAKLMGVCSGIADYTGVDVFWVRLAAVGSIFMTGGPSIIAYFIAGFLLAPLAGSPLFLLPAVAVLLDDPQFFGRFD